MISPTGSNETRETDKHGSGAFKSGRGSHPHYGVDFICIPGQVIVAPHSGLVNRSILCYSDSQKFKGLEILGDDYISKILYIYPKPGIVGKEIKEGDIIGYAQDISERYEGIIKHIHWELWHNPVLYL